MTGLQPRRWSDNFSYEMFVATVAVSDMDKKEDNEKTEKLG